MVRRRTFTVSAKALRTGTVRAPVAVGKSSSEFEQQEKSLANCVGGPILWRFSMNRRQLRQRLLLAGPCVKNRVTVKDSRNVIFEATTWNATDLRDFPVRIETQDQGKTSTLQFRQIQFAKPDEKRFEPPRGYKRTG
jgi:hypothetical protein